MSSGEFTKLLVAYETDPWGDDWLQTAFVAKAAGNLRGKVEDLIPSVANRHRQSDPRTMQSVLLSYLQENAAPTPPPRR